jgi:hypothetical protein
MNGEDYKSVRDLCYKDWGCKELRDNIRANIRYNFNIENIKGLNKWDKKKLVSENERFADMVLMGGLSNGSLEEYVLKYLV